MAKYSIEYFRVNPDVYHNTLYEQCSSIERIVEVVVSDTVDHRIVYKYGQVLTASSEHTPKSEAVWMETYIKQGVFGRAVYSELTTNDHSLHRDDKLVTTLPFSGEQFLTLFNDSPKQIYDAGTMEVGLDMYFLRFPQDCAESVLVATHNRISGELPSWVGEPIPDQGWL